MPDRSFDFVKTTRDGKALSAFKIMCGDAGCNAHHLMVQTGRTAAPATTASVNPGPGRPPCHSPPPPSSRAP